MPDTKTTIHGISVFYMDVIIILMWKVISHATETMRYTSGSSFV